MTKYIKLPVLRVICLAVLFVFLQLGVFAADKDYPDKPDPPRLVNDLANAMTPDQQAQLEAKLDEFSRTTSNQITVVTIKSLGDYDVSDYAITLGNKWGVGKSGKNNGIMVLASINDHKINISTGKGLEGALTDAMCGRIIRNEMAPSFRQGDYFTGFSKAADAIIAATKGEYKGDPEDGKQHIPIIAIVLILAFILWAITRMRGGGNGGGTYMSGRGFGAFGAGWFLGSGLGGFGGGDRGGSNDSGGGGGFGGFGGGGFGGGGASGGW
jgi:uncharacterized protein